MTPSRLYQTLAGRHVLIYLDLLSGIRLPWLDVTTCARLAHLLAFDRIPPPFTHRHDSKWGPLGAPEDEDERLRRQALMWSVYGCDCYLSIMTGWPQIISSEHMTTVLPLPGTSGMSADHAAQLVQSHPLFFATHSQTTPPFMGIYAFYWKTVVLLSDASTLGRRTRHRTAAT